MVSALHPLRLARLILCPGCGNPLGFIDGKRTCCSEPGGAIVDGNIIVYRPGISSPEMIARDRQAGGYLLHDKLPTQIARMQRFIAGLLPDSGPVLDLGCGPGPTTQMLTAKGWKVVAVDFSRRSLELNAAKSALFVQADLRDVRFAKNCFAGLMMADFLQHLGGLDVQREFLQRIFEALAVGGWFFLSFFNANIKNILRGDIDGSFADGQILYRRSVPSQILKMFPADVTVEEVRPMNVFRRPELDDLVTHLPLARLAARMMAITGRKR